MADLFDSKENLFVKVAKFEELFPRLEDATIEWTEEGKGVFHLKTPLADEYEHKASLKHYGELIMCNNPGCRQGGFELRPVIAAMVEENKAFQAGRKDCKGTVAAPRFKSRRKKCPNVIRYKITLVYKECSRR